MIIVIKIAMFENKINSMLIKFDSFDARIKKFNNFIVVVKFVFSFVSFVSFFFRFKFFCLFHFCKKKKLNRFKKSKKKTAKNTLIFDFTIFDYSNKNINF